MRQRKLKIAHSQLLLDCALKSITKGMMHSCYAINATERSISSRLEMAIVPRQFSQKRINMKPNQKLGSENYCTDNSLSPKYITLLLQVREGLTHGIPLRGSQRGLILPSVPIRGLIQNQIIHS